MKENKDFSSDRKMVYGIGMALQVIGLILFLSAFFSGLSSKSSPRQINPGMDPWTRIQSKPKRPSRPSFPIAPLFGFIMAGVGKGLCVLARKGIAGSGLVLDARQEREDLKPISGILGGRINDALEEVNLKDKISPRKEVVKVRCLNCRNLNDESDNFCGKCGKEI